MKSQIHKPKRRKKGREGDVIAIPLGDGSFGFGQVCGFNCYAYFDLRSGEIPDIDEVVACRVLFRVITSDDAIESGGWEILGHRELSPELAQRAMFWSQPVGSNQVSIYRDGAFYRATKEEIQGLENLAAWFAPNVVQRLVEHFSGRLDGVAARVNSVRTYEN